ncbi:NahK/ErcS family hybrid sensor histidine kinase/response regulator [Tepidamorphus sp. 3E244]|uniref:NahK/ErcS family hybrid sensor histidine kinase/response regulator n=1 Tax=Tepidamorphus sp. 3E244 TaxID=3385498 RepID=UPI0038FCC100
MQGWIVVVIALAYLGFLFAVATYGDRLAQRGAWGRGRPLIYALTLGVYCTSWTFFGSVGLASRQGWDFLTIYIGAGLMIGAAFVLVRRIVRLAKAHNITSVADFIASRYGKSQGVAATVAMICIIGTVPYISLQLKAISESLTTIIGHTDAGASASLPVFGDIALLVAVVLAAFAILFGTRHLDATEHQHGLMLAIAAESVIKLVAFLAVGLYVTFVIFDGPGNLMQAINLSPGIAERFTRAPAGGPWLTMILLSFMCAILLPRQFHVAVVENNSEDELRTAAWLFPLYLVAINLFVVPIAAAGLITFGSSGSNPDMFVVMLPLQAGSPLLTIVAFLGGLSAATAMVIVASVALAIMVCNDLIAPLLLRREELQPDQPALGPKLLNIRRAAIFVLLLLSYAYYHALAGNAALASIGLVSFAAIAQLAPAFFLGLIWRGATSWGAMAGMATGIAVWAFTLLVPNFVDAGLISPAILEDGLFGFAFLRPQQLFGIEFTALSHGVFWSLLFNSAAFAGVSLLGQPEAIERLQASQFVPEDLRPMPQGIRLSRTQLRVGEMEATIARYLGEERARRHIESYAAEHGLQLDPQTEADVHLVRHGERILSSAIGAASARVAFSLLLERNNADSISARRLLDDASAALQYNRDLLQSALDHVHQGIGVFDRDLRLICWNRQFRTALELPPAFGLVGTTLNDIYRHALGQTGAVSETVLDERLRDSVRGKPFQIHRPFGDEVMELRPDAMPDGGLVITVSDVSERVRVAQELAAANESLEQRVAERTQALTRLNRELEQARSAAEVANADKTRFLAAAGHDILQPLNAARLYVSSLVERRMRPEERRIAENIDGSLEAVEEILSALLDISRLDAGAMKPEYSVFQLEEILKPLRMEFAAMAQEKDLDLRILSCTAFVHSDRRFVRRLLQNLISNAVKYTQTGRVLVGCRRKGDEIIIHVHDTGAGIPVRQRSAIFSEFKRLDGAEKMARGLGLGLSIVERMARALKTSVELWSVPGQGSTFSIKLPMADAVEQPAPDVRQVRPRRSMTPLSILCIDNEPKILDGMTALLGGWGCNVLTAVSAENALAQLQSRAQPPDVLIVDYHLDEGTGLDAVGTLRETLKTDIPAILLTADRSPEVREQAQAREAIVLHKPVKPAALRAVLARYTRREAAE